MIKKLAVVTRSMHGGGAERVIAQLIKYFNSNEIEIVLITIDKEEIFYELPKDIKIYEIGRKSKNKIIDRIYRYKSLRDICIYENVDLVLSMPEDIGIYVIPTLLGTRIPIVVSERNDPWVMPNKKITRIIRKIFYPYVDGLIFQTDMAASFFSEKLQRKGKVLPNPLDISRIPLPYKGQRKKEVVAVGRLAKQKNFKLLIEAFAEFNKINPEYKLIIYGEGPLRTELETYAKESIPESAFDFPGKKKDVLQMINKSAMFILSSDYEGIPNVLIEAMAMGMPVISTNCPSGGPQTIIVNEKNGLLISVNDKAALVEAMNKLVDSTYSKNLGNNAAELREVLSDNKIYEEWLDYLNAIANK